MPKRKLDAIHPVFKKRCERDGMALEEYWLGDDDLEPDTGGPLDIEHPKEIKTKPLSPKDQDDRIRMVLGLTSNDPLPDVDSDTLEQYHAHLLEQLSFPFCKEHEQDTPVLAGSNRHFVLYAAKTGSLRTRNTGRGRVLDALGAD